MPSNTSDVYSLRNGGGSTSIVISSGRLKLVEQLYHFLRFVVVSCCKRCVWRLSIDGREGTTGQRTRQGGGWRRESYIYICMNDGNDGLLCSHRSYSQLNTIICIFSSTVYISAEDIMSSKLFTTSVSFIFWQYKTSCYTWCQPIAHAEKQIR